jgi:hypothetical protein
MLRGAARGHTAACETLAVKSTVSSRSARAHHTTPSQRTVPHPSASKRLIPPSHRLRLRLQDDHSGSRSGIYTTSEKLQPPLQWIYTYQYINIYAGTYVLYIYIHMCNVLSLCRREAVTLRSRFNSSSRLRRGHVVLRMSLSYTITCSHTAALAGAGAWLTSPSSWHRQ